MSLLMVRKSAPATAADKNENISQDSEIVALWQVLGDAKAYLREGKKNHNVKNVLAAAIKAAEKEDPNDRSVAEAKKVLAQFDSAADADKSEELEREIKGDVVAVVSGNAARVSKDVSFSTAKEGVESFARKNGVSVVASQEYGEAYKFKFSAAIDCAADSSSWQDDDASDVKFAKEQLAVFQGISNSVVRFRMTTPNGTKFAKAYRLAKEILDSVYEIETELKHFV